MSWRLLLLLLALLAGSLEAVPGRLNGNVLSPDRRVGISFTRISTRLDLRASVYTYVYTCGGIVASDFTHSVEEES